MSDFMLIVPSDYVEVDVESVVSQTSVGRGDFEKYESGTDLYEITDALRQIGMISESTEVAYAKWSSDMDRFWVKIT